jgi:Tol biopolymer transport system component
MRRIGFAALCLVATAALWAQGPAPEVFAPGVISGPGNDGAPTFSPDGNTLFFTRTAAHWSVILESHKVNGKWLEPTVAPFSGEWPDASPAMAPDGSFVIFVSVRPDAQTGKSASHIGRSNRAGSGWSTPTELPAAVNFCGNIFRPSVAADGSVYLTAIETGKNLRLYRSSYENRSYRTAEPLSFSDGSFEKDVDPEIAPDQSFVIFASKGRTPEETAHEHLFIVRKEAGNWGKVTRIRYAGDDANGSSDDNDPRLSPDRKTIYFNSDRSIPVQFPRTKQQAIQDLKRMNQWDNSNSNVWMIPLA